MRVDAIDITGSEGRPLQGVPSEPDEHALRIALGRDAHAPSRARHAVAGFSEGCELSASSLATVKLLVSELVSNAVIHSDAPEASDIQLCARRLGDDALRVEVTDEGSGFTAAPRDPGREVGGYGLLLVGSQATRWGIERRRGTCVWFELAERSARR